MSKKTHFTKNSKFEIAKIIGLKYSDNLKKSVSNAEIFDLDSLIFAEKQKIFKI